MISSFSHLCALCARRALALALFGAVLAPAAFAAAPPKGAVISNTASVTYTRPNGVQGTETSNTVKTVVGEVGAFTLDGFATVTTNIHKKVVIKAGEKVTIAHEIKNTGTDRDDFSIAVKPDADSQFSKVEVFANDDATKALCSSNDGKAICSTTAQAVKGVASNGVFKFNVVYTIATGASASLSAAGVSAKPQKPGKYAADNQEASDRDVIDLNAALFSVVKSIDGTKTAAPDGKPWPAALNSGPASRAGAQCASDWKGFRAAPNADNCVYTVFTLAIRNSGNAAGRFVLTDPIPMGMSYVAGSAVWSEAPGVSLVNSSTPGIDFDSAKYVVNAIIESVAPHTTQYLSFMVSVNQNAALGVSSTTNTAKYKSTQSDVPAGAIKDTDSFSNPASYVVKARVAGQLALGADGATFTDTHDIVKGTSNSNVFDDIKQPVAGGKSAVFKLQVLNPDKIPGPLRVDFDLVNPWITGAKIYVKSAETPKLDITSANGSPRFFSLNGGETKTEFSIIFENLSSADLSKAALAMKIAVSAPAKSGAPQSPAESDTTTIAVVAADKTKSDDGVKLTILKDQFRDPVCNKSLDVSSAVFTTDALSAKPGECIVYRIQAKNNNVEVMKNVSIKDAVPQYTKLTWANRLCVLDGSSSTYFPFFATDTTVFCGKDGQPNTMPPSSTLTLIFTVRIDAK